MSDIPQPNAGSNTAEIERVAAIIVSYHPDLAVLFQLLDSLSSQVEFLILVDNGSGQDLPAALNTRGRGKQIFIPLEKNQGIAAAQNEGIAQARKLDASHVIFFDHDSCPAPDMVKKLLATLHWLSTQGRQVASIGPCYVDTRQDNPPLFIRTQGISLHRCLTPEEGDAVAVDHLIASGCLVPMPVLDQVGTMNPDLFIDYVDMEWGLRARHMGYQNYGCFSAKMHHSLGDEPIRFLGTAYPARTPLRHYYTFRNAVLLSRMSHIPRNWKWANGLRLGLKFGFYTLLAKPRLQHLRMMLQGLWHGVQGRTGKL